MLTWADDEQKLVYVAVKRATSGFTAMPRGYEKEDLLQEGALVWLEWRDKWNASISEKSTFLFKVVLARIYRIMEVGNSNKQLADRDSVKMVDGLTPCVTTFNAEYGSMVARSIYGYGHKKTPIRKTGWEE